MVIMLKLKDIFSIITLIRTKAMADYITGIKKTGFILENSIIEQLKTFDWTIINNRFYEDDLSDTVREMDILAYKTSTVDEIEVYTVLLISCKKNEENAWILLSRNIDLEDINSNWWPLHIWSNDIGIQEYLKNKDSGKSYYNFTSKEKGITVMDDPKFDVFAFQELSKKNGNPQNDKNIFSS